MYELLVGQGTALRLFGKGTPNGAETTGTCMPHSAMW